MGHGYEIILFSHGKGIRNLIPYLQKCEINTYVANKKGQKSKKKASEMQL